MFLIIVATFSTFLNNSSTEAFSIYRSPPKRIQNKSVTSEMKNNYCRFLLGHKFIFGYKLCFSILLKKLKSSFKKEQENLQRRKIMVSTITNPKAIETGIILLTD